MRGLKRLVLAMYAILEDPRATRIEKIESAKVIAACSGILLPDTSEGLLSTRSAIALRQAKTAIVEKMVRHKEKKRLENRKGYLKRKLRALEADQPAMETHEQPA